MNFTDLEILRDNPDPSFPLPFPINSIAEKGDSLIINGKIAIAIEKTASFFKTGLDISVYNAEKTEIGLLVFTYELGEVNISSLTESQFIAYLKEATIVNLEKPYRFKKNYF